ncbi:16S rRNA (guanine(966)-N(2))-methyltransferase RsmD [Ignavibacteriales bacterium]
MRLRIISGELGGRFVKTPDSKYTRPTTDKVKQSIFNYLSNFYDFQDSVVADIYSGSGSLGFEMLSRGAKEVHFVEKNFPVIKVLSENITSLGVEKLVKIHKMSAVTFSANIGIKFDIIMADPPFFNYDIHQVVKNILRRGLLNDGGIFLLERSIQTLEKDSEAFGITPFKRLGDTCLYSFETASEEKTEAEN